MRAKPTISAVSFAKNDSKDMPQNSSNSPGFNQKKKGTDGFLGLFEDFPDNSSYESANYWSDPKDPKLTQRCTANN